MGGRKGKRTKGEERRMDEKRREKGSEGKELVSLGGRE